MEEPSARRGYAVFLGLDVGKGEHHATALDPEGHRMHDRPLPCLLYTSDAADDTASV